MQSVCDEKKYFKQSKDTEDQQVLNINHNMTTAALEKGYN